MKHYVAQRQFVENELNPNIPEWEEAGRFPIHDVFKKMGDLGLWGFVSLRKMVVWL